MTPTRTMASGSEAETRRTKRLKNFFKFCHNLRQRSFTAKEPFVECGYVASHFLRKDLKCP